MSTRAQNNGRGRGAPRASLARRTNNRQQDKGARPSEPEAAIPQEATNEEAPPADNDVCWICATQVKFYSVSECNHRTCHVCAIRLRALYKKTDCTFCKLPQPTLIFTTDPDKAFESYDVEFMPYSDARLSITSETKEMMEEALILLRFNCPDEDCEFVAAGWSDLKWHVKDRHGKVMCDICIKNKKIFSHEHTLYTPAGLIQHVPSMRRHTGAKEKDKEPAPAEAHPMCDFCRECFYSDDELFGHLRERHEECFICKRAGIRDQYFQNYDRLEHHFRVDHFPCNHATCLEQKFVVFASQLDLQAHMVDTHGEEMSSKDKRGVRRVEVPFAPVNDGRGRGAGRGRGGVGGRDGRDGLPDPPPPLNQPPGVSSRRAGFGGQLTTNQGQIGGPANPPVRDDPVDRTSTPDARTLELHTTFMNYVQSVAPSPNSLSAVKVYIKSYRNGESNGKDLVDSLFNIFDRDMDRTAGVLSRLVDLFEDERRSEILTAWNGMKAEHQQQYPSLNASGGSTNFAGIASGVVINVKHSTVSRGRSNRQVWDRVAQAASSSASSPNHSRSNTPNVGGASSSRVVPGSAGYSAASSGSTAGFPSLSSSLAAPAPRPIQNQTPWLSNSSSISSTAPAIKPYSVSAPKESGDKRGRKAPSTTSKELFPDLPTVERTAVPRGFVGGNQSLRNILGEAASPSNVWGSSKSGPGSNDGADEPRSNTDNGGGSNQPKGKKKKGKETLFTLGAFPG